MKRPRSSVRQEPSQSSETTVAPLRAPRLLTRRRVLVVGAAALAYTALRPTLALARRASRETPGLQPWSLARAAPGQPVEFARAVMSAAVLAPSHWNTQPWRLEFDPGTIRLVADPTRALPGLDPDRRSLTIALGGALENMLIALRAYGQRPAVTYFPRETDRDLVASITWSPDEAPRDRLLFGAIPERRTNRRDYDGRGIYPQNRNALAALIPQDLHLRWIEERAALRTFADLAADAAESQVRDARLQRERMRWMRFGDDEARRRGDGVTLDALELGGPGRWLGGRAFDPESFFIGLGAGSEARRARDAVRSAGALVLISSPRNGDAVALTAGQAWQRFALRATTLGIAQQVMSAPLEVARHRPDVLRAFGAIGETPLLFARLGHARPPDASVRRAVNLVATFRNS
ncbi:MAG: hypothetical protein HOP12_13335 [Candidatus Eisenbacteria bacterium]|uniref:Nitroreductase domain-containing protein n=1 Tax=Eiseniibacteriota bacterium TaxID=2212470 RepID=A0A849SST5_UNCEI|nr:hypothetical protein [Candidatus Eisenbacteria bacterium]